jgi:cytochrome c oxidase subunit IV
MPLFNCSDNTSTIRTIHFAAMLLIGLTCLTTAISYYPFVIQSPENISLDNIRPSIRFIGIVVITLMTMIKGIQIVDIFMEMSNTPKKWRRLALSYPIIIPMLLTIILYL